MSHLLRCDYCGALRSDYEPDKWTEVIRPVWDETERQWSTHTYTQHMCVPCTGRLRELITPPT